MINMCKDIQPKMSNKLKNNFIASSISDLYLQPDLADVNFEFQIDDKTIKVPAHKCILAGASKVFRAMFFGPLKEGEIVRVNDADPSAFKEFLQFFYLPEIEITMENIEAVVLLADKYDMPKYVNTCTEFLERQLTKDTIIWGYQLALSLDNEKLKQFCEMEIETHSKDVFKSDTFLRCDKAVVENILKFNSLHCREIDLFEACIEWAETCCARDGLDQNNSENVRKQLGEFLHSIRFASMTVEEIGMITSKERYEALFSREELRDIRGMKTVENFQPNIFKQTKRALKWNGNHDLVCDLILSTSTGSTYYINNRESTWLSTNVPVILGGIELIQIFGSSFSSNITIVEYSDHTFVANQATKVLYSAAYFFSTDASIKLNEPIVVQPKKLYEIQMNSLEPFGSPYHYSMWTSEVKLAKGVIIRLHQHPSERRGIASKLHLNTI